MTKITDFYTRENSNKGIKLDLVLPDGGKTKEYLTIRGIDSDVFRHAEAEAKQNALSIASLENEDERKKAIAEEKLTLISSLVINWTFDEACNLENIKNFIREAPQVGDQIDLLASKRSLFFKERSTSS